MRTLLPLIALVLTGCGRCGNGLLDSGDSADTWAPPVASEDLGRDLLHTSLAVDMDSLTATAAITVAGSETTGLSLEVQGLEILQVYTEEGALDWTIADGRLDVGVPADGTDPVITVDYAFAEQETFEGWMETGSTLVWPYHCGNLFPCHSDPSDGLSFELEIRTQQEGNVAVYPASIPADAPSYQIAWAMGIYERLALGSTAGGVDLEVWYLAGHEANAVAGTEHLLGAWEWFEATLGPYPFGARAGSVEVSWGPGAYGGMEHHPLFHVATGAMGDRVTQIHEAAHGWFGGGVRIACWEDFALSEGTVTYLTARAITEVVGAEAGDEIWADYEDSLDYAIDNEVIESWPEGCGEVDILDDGLFSLGPYYKGAWFYRDYAELVGVDELDAALGSFFADHVGQAVTMQQMMDHLHLECGVDPMPLADGWLRSMGDPRDAR